MDNLEVIRIYSGRARATAGSIGAGAPWPVRLFVWLVLLPLAIIAIAMAIILAAGFLIIALARSLIISLFRTAGRTFGPGDGRRNVRVIDPSQRQ
ncbi:MAG: hypothetical protein IT436_01345 [Phycisphaerales bacterium]|nr:hypothetical protein [Phycisphaerales bacterium]